MLSLLPSLNPCAWLKIHDVNAVIQDVLSSIPPLMTCSNGGYLYTPQSYYSTSRLTEKLANVRWIFTRKCDSYALFSYIFNPYSLRTRGKVPCMKDIQNTKEKCTVLFINIMCM